MNPKKQIIKTCPFNRKLKAPGQNIEYTKEQLEEYIKCKNSLLYFVQNYGKIVTLDGGLEQFVAWDFQIDILNALQVDDFVAMNSSRQCSKSLLMSLGVVHFLIFNDYKKVAILANKMATVKAILNDKIKICYENLPLWLQQGVLVWNINSFELENYSSVAVYPTSESSIRGLSVALLVVDEVGIIRESIWNEFAKSSFPVVSSGKGKIWLFSTPKGMNHWHKIVTQAKLKKNNFKLFEVMWNDIPTRTQEWFDNEVNLHGLEYARQEYCCKFIGTSGTLIKGSILEEIINDINSNVKEITIEKVKKFKNLEKYFNNIRVFELPKEDHLYSCSLDSATNTDEDDGDSASIQILDVTELPFVQVATADFIDDTSYLEIPFVQVALSKIYNDAIIFNENNDGAGREANITIVNEIGYEHIYWGDKEKIAGYRTTSLTKSKGCSNLKNLIEHGYLKLNDSTTLNQLFTFSKSGGTYKATEKHFDDSVMALIGCLYFLQLQQEQIETIFNGRCYYLPPVNDLLKIIHTTVNDSIENDVIKSEDGNIEFKNEVLNVKEERVNLNDLINTIGSDPEVLFRKLNRERNIVETMVGAEYDIKNEDAKLTMMGFDDDDKKPKRKKSIDDYLFDD